jgi:hypothetical protein
MTVGDCRQEVNADQAIATQAAEAATLSGATRTESVGVITAEKLSEIADRDGIKGLRAIAEPLGIKSNSIADMMRAILEKQGA